MLTIRDGVSRTIVSKIHLGPRHVTNLHSVWLKFFYHVLSTGVVNLVQLLGEEACLRLCVANAVILGAPLVKLSSLVKAQWTPANSASNGERLLFLILNVVLSQLTIFIPRLSSSGAFHCVRTYHIPSEGAASVQTRRSLEVSRGESLMCCLRAAFIASSSCCRSSFQKKGAVAAQSFLKS